MPAHERDIKSSHARTIRALRLRPAHGHITATTVATLRPGATAVDIRDGDFHIVSDVGPESGGKALGPDPGILIRAGLAACLASAYRMWSEYMDVALDEVEVTVEADMDTGGMYGTAEAPPGYQRLRAKVRIVSDAPEARVREVVDYADRHSPLLYDLRTPIEVTRETIIIGGTNS